MEITAPEWKHLISVLHFPFPVIGFRDHTLISPMNYCCRIPETAGVVYRKSCTANNIKASRTNPKTE